MCPAGQAGPAPHVTSHRLERPLPLHLTPLQTHLLATHTQRIRSWGWAWHSPRHPEAGAQSPPHIQTPANLQDGIHHPAAPPQDDATTTGSQAGAAALSGQNLLLLAPLERTHAAASSMQKVPYWRAQSRAAQAPAAGKQRPFSPSAQQAPMKTVSSEACASSNEDEEAASATIPEAYAALSTSSHPERQPAKRRRLQGVQSVHEVVNEPDQPVQAGSAAAAAAGQEVTTAHCESPEWHGQPEIVLTHLAFVLGVALNATELQVGTVASRLAHKAFTSLQRLGVKSSKTVPASSD